MRLAILLPTVLVLSILSGCGAVTDPLDDQPDPRPVLGEWYTPALGEEPALYRARIEGAGAPLYGEFRFPLHGRTWYVDFRDSEWTGRTLTFATETDFGFTLPDTTVHWAATLTRGRGEPRRPDWRPARLSLAAYTSDGLAFTWDYLRYEDLIVLAPELEEAPIR